MWALVGKIVPGSEEQLRAARPRVEIADDGEHYLVRVRTATEVLERSYSDPERDCGRRARFVAEFIVLALMPPQLATEAAQVGEPSASGKAENGPSVSTPAPREAPAHKAVTPAVWIELSATGTASPSILGAPSALAWGGDLRGCLGSGALAGILGVGFTPSTDFTVGDLRGTITRVPAVAGARIRTTVGAFYVSGDIGLVLAWERYAGTSPKTPGDATRLAPGIEADLMASTKPLARLAPFVRLTSEVLPFTDALGTTPEGILGKTPSLWLGGALGLAVAM